MNVYNGFKIMFPLRKMNIHYLEKIESTVRKSLKDYNRVYAVRVDLRLPSLGDETDFLMRDEIVNNRFDQKNIIKRFIESLKAKIESQDKAKKRRGKRNYFSKVRYVWCRERVTSENDHYHVVLLFNKDKFFKLGAYDCPGSLSNIIMCAWCSALGEQVEGGSRLVEFVNNGRFYLNQRDAGFEEDLEDFIYAISYLAKIKSKNYNENKRSFGYSLL